MKRLRQHLSRDHPVLPAGTLGIQNCIEKSFSPVQAICFELENGLKQIDVCTRSGLARRKGV